jgi:methyl-accepting chemotaxis protein
MNLTAYMGRFKIGTRIYAGFLVLLCLLAALAFTGYSSLSSTNERTNEYIRISGQTENVLESDSESF